MISQDDYKELETLSISKHGDARERTLWLKMGPHLSEYETFWRTFVVLLTNRIDSRIERNDPEWIRLRQGVPPDVERLLIYNYSVFRLAASARKAIDLEQARAIAGEHGCPEVVFFLLCACTENEVQLRSNAMTFLKCCGVKPTGAKTPWESIETISAYRNALVHSPVPGRSVMYGRELLPPQQLLPKKKNDPPLLWSATDKVPKKNMVNAQNLEEEMWNSIAEYLQKLWSCLAKGFREARTTQQCVECLNLSPFLPIHLSPSPQP